MRKTLLLKLIAILLICVLGMQSAALANPTGNTSSLAYGKEIEIEELRTTDSKTYQLSDGSFKYVGYAEEVHYKDSNGKFADIDNSITSSAEKDGYTYTNKANSWRAYFSNQLSVSKAVLLETGDYSLSFSMPSASQQNAAKKTADMTEHADSYYEDKKSDNRAVIYQEALTGVDVVYTVRTSGLKEDIVLKNAAVPHSFEFVLTADGLTAVKRDGTVYFQDREGNDIFHIGSLYMIDSNGKYSESVTCSIQQVKNGYSLVISASEEFLNAADTVYPVIIDPSIMITGTSNTFDTCVDEQYPSSNYYASENLWTGGATGTNTMRTYIKFTMPSNITAAQVTSATLRIKKREHKTPTIKAYRVTSSWSSSSVTWNNKPSYTTANGTGTITLDTGSWYKLDTTTLVKYWLAGTYSNYGFLLKEPSETSSSQKTKFYSSDAPSPNKPELIIEYIDPPTGDSWEPNNTMATASTVSSTTMISANLHTSSDIDFYKFTVGSACNVSIALSNIPINCNYEMQLLNSAGSTLVSSIKESNTGEFIRTRLTSSGTYYIKIWSHSSSSSINYKLEISSFSGERNYVAVYGAEQGTDGGLFPPYYDKTEDVVRFCNNMNDRFPSTPYFQSSYALKADILGNNLSSGQATIVYWSGHTAFPDGGSATNPVSRASYYTDRNDSSYVSYDASLNVSDPFNMPDYVGNTIQSSNSTNGYYSNTQWNKGLKWAIISACNHFTYPNHYKKWARALLGKESRAHGILGYAEKAPVGPGDFNVVDDFFALSGNNYSILHSWIQANLNNSYVSDGVIRLEKAAVMVHSLYASEKLSDMYQNTPGTVSSRFDAPNIRLYTGNTTSWGNIPLSAPQIPIKPDNDLFAGILTRESLNSLSSTDGIHHMKDSLNRDVFIRGDTVTLMVQPIDLDLKKELSLTDEQAIRVALSFALANGMVAENAFLDWDFYVYELIEETVDVLEIGIDRYPIIAGYYVLAFNPNDENAREYVVENGMEVLHIKNCFAAIIDANGVCSISSKLN